MVRSNTIQAASCDLWQEGGSAIVNRAPGVYRVMSEALLEKRTLQPRREPEIRTIVELPGLRRATDGRQ